MASFNWESTTDSYPPPSNPKPKDSNLTDASGTAISPPYSDSSSSPSSEDAAESRPNGDSEHKRKASHDDIDVDEQQPTSKSMTTAENRLNRNIAPSRRKSGGERDDSKLLKRKEQNRAAQRAFRERKEKHVKDLEDKVAQLEAKNESQAAENENLRDMLNRLQAENSILRQSPFSFSLPNGSGMPVAPSSNSFSLPEPNPSHTSTDSTSNVATQARDSPQSNFNSQFFESPSTDNSSSLTDADLDPMALFGGPFTTVASNPMFMSYRDPTESMNAFASFGGWDDMNVVNTFGDQLNGLTTLNSEDITASQKTGNTLMSYDAQFQAALANKPPPQEFEPCMIDQLCQDMQRKATCTALH